MNYVSSKEAIELLNITSSILYKLKNTGKINFKLNENKKSQVLYDIDSAIIEEPEDGKICPFCGKHIGKHNGHHIYTCSKRDLNLSKEEIKDLYLKTNYGEDIFENIIKNY